MKHGGKRPGAGRKPTGQRKKPFATRLRPDQIEWLKKRSKPAARVLEELIDKEIIKED